MRLILNVMRHGGICYDDLSICIMMFVHSMNDGASKTCKITNMLVLKQIFVKFRAVCGECDISLRTINLQQ